MSNDKSKYITSLKVLYLTKFCGTFYIYNPILIYYLINKVNLSYFEIGSVTATFYIGAVIFNIPSGIIADKIGRKLSIQIGYIIQALSMFMLASANDYIMCILAHLLLSLGISFISGAEETLLFDLYKLNDDVKNIKKGRGNILTSTLCAGIISSILSSVLVMQNYELTFYVTAIFMVAAMLLASNVYEIKRDTKHIKTLYIFSDIIKEFKNNRTLISRTVFRVIYGTIFLNIYTNFQTYMTYLKLDISYSGIIYAILALCPIITISISKYIKDIYIMKYTPIISAMVLLTLGYTKNLFLGISLLCIFRLLYGAFYPLISSEIDISIRTDEIRTSIISTIEAIESLFSATAMILCGKIIDLYGIKYVMYISCGICLICIMMKLIIKVHDKTIMIGE